MTRTRRRSAAALALAVSVAALAAATAGAQRRSRRSRRALARRLLDAEDPVRPAHRRLPEDAGGRGRQVHAELRRLDRPGAGGRAGPPDRRRAALARRRHQPPRRREARLEELEPHQVQRHGHELARDVPRPQGQPEEHPHLGRPDQARHRDRPAEPGQLGRRALGRDGRLRAGARPEEDAGEGAGLPAGVLQEHRLAGQERP